ncbi:RDD family protein [Streptomyces tardus]|nr:RDD family protein [Streptomyces tardus]
MQPTPVPPAPAQSAPETASPRHEQTTQLRRSDIVKARHAAREAQAAQQAAAPAQAPAQPGPRSAPPAQPTPEGGWQQQVRDLAAPPGGHGGSPQGGDGLAAPWRPPASDPFLRAAMDQARPAALGKRVAARLIDTLVTAAVGAAVALPLLPKARDHLDAKVAEIEQAGVTRDIWLVDGTTGLYLAMVIGAVLVFGLLYEALPNARWGRTLGKKLLGLRVLSMEEQEPPGFGRAAVRWLVQGSLGFLVIGVVNLFWAFVDKPWRQCWHDKAAGTFTAEGGGEVRLG